MATFLHPLLGEGEGQGEIEGRGRRGQWGENGEGMDYGDVGNGNARKNSPMSYIARKLFSGIMSRIVCHLKVTELQS